MLPPTTPSTPTKPAPPFQWETHLSKQEASYYAGLFQRIAKTKPTLVTGQEAVQFFATCGVPHPILSNVWEAADHENKGYLTPETFSIALKLIACAQHGQPVAHPVLSTVVSLPQFEGVSLSTTTDPTAVILPVDRDKYYAIFNAQNPKNNCLEADIAKSIFIRSQLPEETLSKIWHLADVRRSGTLRQEEFAIAMHYIAKTMDNSLPHLPSQLPASVHASAYVSVPVASRPLSSPPQRAQTIDSLSSLAFSSNAPVQTPSAWKIDPQEKITYDQFFDKMDMARTGSLMGKEAVEFFKNSQLPEQELAFIWDLADSQQRGQLSKDEFAVAMHLIHARLRGEPLPTTMPRHWVPPSPQISTLAQTPQGFGNANTQGDTDLLSDFGNSPVRTPNTIPHLHSIKAKTPLTSEQTLAHLSQQKQELNATMAHIRMAHEAHVKDLNELEEKARQEESELTRAQMAYDETQKHLVETQTTIVEMRNKIETSRLETVRLKERQLAIQQETVAAQSELERLKGQMKQQSMMLDINHRQVTASENDRDQAKKDLEEYRAEHGLPVMSEEEVLQANDTPATATATATAATTSNFFELFSPHLVEAEERLQTESNTTAYSPNAFDAIFGRMSDSAAASPLVTSPFVTSTPPISASTPTTNDFDPLAWIHTDKSAMSPVGSLRRPPPPPQSRHGRPSSDITSPLDTQKSPFSSPFFSQVPEIESVLTSEPKAPFVNEPIPNANANAFQLKDAFSFNITTPPITTIKKDSKGKGKSVDHGPQSYFDNSQDRDAFGFSTEETAPVQNKAPTDWDSIFGAHSTQDTPSYATATVSGFDDVFSEASPKEKGKKAPPPPPPTSQPVPVPVSVSGIGLGRAEKIEDLVKMGFLRQDAKEALDRYDQDVDKATNFLLDQTNE
ncbi:hypothetical protein BDF14DRAFT_1883837 [Spinellus fusiger]|nr:hypothetical protein BDF14DRAFT_1883837 [Spinellus fusiger]